MAQKGHKYWIVNNSKEDAVSAVKKIVEAQKKGYDIIELTDSEYRYLHNQEACRYIVEEGE